MAFEGFNLRTIDFMWGIRLNNDRAWFTEHKEEYISNFYEPMKALGNAVFEQINDLYPKYGFALRVARIYRDARRVRDGRPYRDLLWFTIERPGQETGTVLWYELNPESWYYALGFYTNPAGMSKYRARIDKNPKKFERLIDLLDKTECKLECEEYARKKEAPSKKTAEWYNKKYINLIHGKKNGDELYSPQFADHLVSGFKSLIPFYDFFVTINNDPDPRDNDKG